MAEVLRRALYARVAAGAADSLAVPDGSYRWRVPADESAPDRGGRTGRGTAVHRRTGAGAGPDRAVRPGPGRAARRARGRTPGCAGSNGPARSAPTSTPSGPGVRPEEVVARLLGDPDALARAADGLLDDDEQKAVRWSAAGAPRSWRSARWSAADLVLLDEVGGLLEHPEGYRHIVVDEAQDLSPMECRAIARRAAFGSLHRPRRPGPGDHAVGGAVVADDPRAPGPAGRDRDAADHRFPGAAGGRRPRQPAAGAAGRGRAGGPLPARGRRADDAPRRTRGGREPRSSTPYGTLSPGRAPSVSSPPTRTCPGRGTPSTPPGSRRRDQRRWAPGWPWCPRVSSRDWSTTTSSPSNRRRSRRRRAPEGGACNRLYVVLTRAVSRLDVVHGRPLPF